MTTFLGAVAELGLTSMLASLTVFQYTPNTLTRMLWRQPMYGGLST